MDAATLYIVLTFPNGEQCTSTKWFGTLEACETYATSQQLRDYANQPPGARIEYRCDAHPMIGGGFVLDICEGRDTPCAQFGPWPHLKPMRSA
jgi:hypothetical protein